MSDLADRLTAVDPHRLVQLLELAGFTKVGERAGVYARMAWPDAGSRDNTMIVPFDPAMSDYLELLAGVLLTLDDAAYRGRRARDVLDALGGPLASVKET